MAGENDTFLLTRPDFEMTSDSAAVMYSLIGSCKTSRNRAGNVATPRDQCNQHLACQPHERVVALERHSLCKLIFTPRPSRCAYTLDKYVNDKLKIIRAFPVTILVVGNEISLADRKCT